jgi:sugar phosphate isomerase/epimerase
VDRRQFFITAGIGSLAAASTPAAAAPAPAAPQPAPVKLGIDIFSLRSQDWSPFQSMDYCVSQRAKVVHFSEPRFLGSLEKDHLLKVKARAAQLQLEVEIGMGSICPTSKAFKAADGTAEEQLTRMITAATVVGSELVRCVLGTAADRTPGPIEKHIEDTVKVLRNIRSRAVDANVKIAIENHAGDMQAWELKTLIEGAGTDFVGVCLDSGNPLWTLEDPHLTLETLAPHVLTSHTRDTAVWNTPEGSAVTWVRMGEGNVGIDAYLRKFVELCPGRPLSLESIVFGPRMFPWRKREFWAAYPKARAGEFTRFLEISEKGKPAPDYPWERGKDMERADLEASLLHVRSLFSI